MKDHNYITDIRVGMPVLWVDVKTWGEFLSEGIVTHTTKENGFVVTWSNGRKITYSNMPVDYVTGKPKIQVDIVRLRDITIESILS